jgi:CRISPR-associated protein Cas2
MTRADVRRTLVAYDIPDDKRRSRVAKVLQSFGDRVQYSVFVIDAAPVGIARMRRKVDDLIEPDEDSVLICDLGLLESQSDARFSYLGRVPKTTDASSFVL